MYQCTPNQYPWKTGPEWSETAKTPQNRGWTKMRQVFIYSFANECVLLFKRQHWNNSSEQWKKLVEEILPFVIFVTVDYEISREMEMLQFIAVTRIWKHHGSSAFFLANTTNMGDFAYQRAWGHLRLPKNSTGHQATLNPAKLAKTGEALGQVLHGGWLSLKSSC